MDKEGAFIKEAGVLMFNPPKGSGFFSEISLRAIADELERRNVSKTD